MTIIPAIDIIDGKCVRLSEGDYTRKTIYNEDPLEVARQFEDAGISRLHLVDLDGAKAKQVVNWKVLEKIATHTSLVIDFGGGILSVSDLQAVFESGAAFATIGSLAVKQPAIFAEWLNRFGADKFLLGADVRNEQITIHGWLEQTELPVIDFIRSYVQQGLQQVFCTDVSKDGMLTGPATALYARIVEAIPDVRLIASGGVSEMADLDQLKQAGCKGVIIGKAIYEGRVTLQELRNWTIQNN